MEPIAIRHIRRLQEHLAGLTGRGPVITDERGQNPRTPYQFFLSVFFYLTWRSGDPWRSFQISGQRHHSERWYYLDAKRLLQEVFFSSQILPQKKPVARAVNSLSARAAGFGGGA